MRNLSDTMGRLWARVWGMSAQGCHFSSQPNPHAGVDFQWTEIQIQNTNTRCEECLRKAAMPTLLISPQPPHHQFSMNENTNKKYKFKIWGMSAQGWCPHASILLQANHTTSSCKGLVFNESSYRWVKLGFQAVVSHSQDRSRQISRIWGQGSLFIYFFQRPVTRKKYHPPTC